jgi:four helix bundle protein
MFDHQKLHVYRLQLEFLQWVTPLLEEAQRHDAGKTSEVRRHLDQASLSVLLNIAEGNGRRGQQTRAKFFDDARGSAAESAACLDAGGQTRVLVRSHPTGEGHAGTRLLHAHEAGGAI